MVGQIMKCNEVGLNSIASILEDKAIAKELKISLAPKDGDRYFVAKQGRKIVAIAVIRPIANSTFPWRGKAAEIKCLYVYPDHRRLGVGSQLLQFVMESIDCPFKATVLPNTEDFYKKHGFKKVFQQGRYPVYATDVELCVQ